MQLQHVISTLFNSKVTGGQCAAVYRTWFEHVCDECFQLCLVCCVHGQILFPHGAGSLQDSVYWQLQATQGAYCCCCSSGSSLAFLLVGNCMVQRLPLLHHSSVTTHVGNHCNSLCMVGTTRQHMTQKMYIAAVVITCSPDVNRRPVCSGGVNPELIACTGCNNQLHVLCSITGCWSTILVSPLSLHAGKYRRMKRKRDNEDCGPATSGAAQNMQVIVAPCACNEFWIGLSTKHRLACCSHLECMLPSCLTLLCHLDSAQPRMLVTYG